MRIGNCASINLTRLCEEGIPNPFGVIMMNGEIGFNKLVYYSSITNTHRELTRRDEANKYYEDTTSKKLFLSHKTGDSEAELLANQLARMFRIVIYLAEWDPNVTHDSPSLPGYIKRQIKTSNAFLVCANPQVAISMWVGYEIGIADASSLPCARVTKTFIDRKLPSVVRALRRLSTDSEIADWVRTNVTKQHRNL